MKIDTAKLTPLYDLHIAYQARMTTFAGYEMPLQYPTGIMMEHNHTRRAAGLFDISHMGQIVISGTKQGDTARALEALIPADIIGLPNGRQRYSYFTNIEGGILDDLMIARLDDKLILVCNAARKHDDLVHLLAHISNNAEVKMVDRALISLQGPRSAAILEQLAPGVSEMRFMDVRSVKISGAECIIMRSGYTGEDGYEISMPAEEASIIVKSLLAIDGVLLIGLGARDTLRLEAGLCLYGADIDSTTTPTEAVIEWAIPKIRRTQGARAGGFPGANRILHEIEYGAARRRIGLSPEGRAPVRAGAPLFVRDDDVKPIGVVTSGGFGPSIDAPIAMGYVPVFYSKPETRLFVELRGRRLAVTVTRLPFVDHSYKRG